jgi:hypothetical protein
MRVGRSGKHHDTRLLAGLEYIAARQNADGSFTTLGEDVMLHATILQALCNVPMPAAQAICSQLAAWVATQYRSQARHPHGYLYSLRALQAHDPAHITGDMLGEVAALLVSLEQSVGGPYYDRPGGSLEPATNALIAQFITQAAGPLPQVTAYLQQVVSKRAFTSPYYSEQLAAVHHIAQALPAADITRWLTRQAAAASATGLALIANSLQALHQPVPPELTAQLLAAQNTDGSWPAGAYASSHDPPLISTALAVAALAALSLAPDTAPDTQQPRTAPRPAPFHTPAGNALYQQIFAQTHAIFHALGPSLYHKATPMLDLIREVDTNQEILLLPYFFTASLKSHPALPRRQFFIDLGIANLCNWMAFTLYDDFYDEVAEPALLPVANAALHHSLRHFSLALPDHRQFQQLVHDTFDRLDSANAWEIASSRMSFAGPNVTIPALPHFIGLRRLAERSYTHILPVLAVLAHYGRDLDDIPAQAIRASGRHYLISRQLNDDMHDWEEDLRAGNLTYTLVRVCQELNIGPGTYNFDELFARIRRQFWQHTISNICDDLEVHIQKGTQAATRSGLLVPDSIFDELFASLARTLAHTRAEHQQSMQFLQAYGKG